MSCPAPPTTTTTTTTRRPGMLTIPERSTYEVASYDGNSMYPDCPKFFSDCRIVQLNDSALQLMTWNWNADFSFRVSSKWMHLDINKTHELDKYFLTYFSVSILTKMLSIEACRQTVLPDRSYLIGHKLVEMSKFKCDISSNFQTISGHNSVQCVWRCNMHVFTQPQWNKMHIFMERFQTQIPQIRTISTSNWRHCHGKCTNPRLSQLPSSPAQII